MEMMREPEFLAGLGRAAIVIVLTVVYGRLIFSVAQNIHRRFRGKPFRFRGRVEIHCADDVWDSVLSGMTVMTAFALAGFTLAGLMAAGILRVE